MVCRWLKTPAIHECGSSDLLEEQTAATGNGNKQPGPTKPCADTVCCFWRCWAVAETTVFSRLLLGKTHFSPTAASPLTVSASPRHTTPSARTQFEPQDHSRNGLFSGILVLTGTTALFGISCSTANVNPPDWTGLQYFWQQHT